MSRARHIVRLGILAALALALSFAESFLPLPGLFPGAKLGLANLVTVLALYLFPSWRSTAAILFVRVLLGAGFAGGGALWYSGAGAVLSFAVMCLFYRMGVGITVTSAAGGVAHNVGQLLAAMLVLRSTALLAWLPFLLAAGFAAGLAVGLSAAVLLPVIRANWGGARRG